MINSTYKKANRLLHIIFFIFFIQLVFSQIYPVQVNSNVIPPYLSSVSKYTTTTNQKYLVNIFTNDLNVVNRQVKLKLYIQGNGINAQSAPVVVGANPLFINGGESVQLNNLDLEPYFELQNLQGINPQQYSGVLPQGSYNFCIEVYDFITNQPISQKSCTFFYFIYNEPPLLNLPFNHDVIHFQDPQNIIFTWTPRHSNATNIEYEFTLIELLDNQAPSNYAFIVGAPVWQEVLNNTILNYNFNFPQLTAGKKYAWRVKALTQPGFGEDAVFNNNGYSEIYDFVYAGNCNAPEFVLAQSTSARQAKILWQNNPNHLSNNVKFRKSGTQEWFDAPVANGQALLLDLEPSATYEFQVGGICLGDITSFSAINQFMQPAKDVVAINCGIAPNIDLTNVTLYNEELKKDMVFMAADYSIHIKESQGVGTYTGKGWTRVPFFKNLKIAVEFENIKLNSELKLVEGNVKAQYDPSWGNILDVNEVIDVVDDILDPLQASKDVHNHQVNFVIGSTANIMVKNGQIIITTPQGTTGAIFDFDQGENTTITDANGTVYTVDPKGNVILGQQGTGIASSSNTENTNSDGKVTALSAIGAKVVFKRSSSSKAFDDTSADYTNLPSKLANKYKTIKDGDDNDYPIYYKAVVNKEDGTKTVDYVTAEITITDTILKAKDIIFSLNGLKLTATDSITNSNVTIKTLEIPVFTTIGELELLALVKNGTEKQKVIGAMTVIPIKDVGIVNISLVPVNGVTISSDDIVAVQKIYSQAGVTLNITTLPAYQDRSIKTLECGTSGFIANYTTEQNAFIDRYKATKTISDNQYLLFVTKDIKPSRPISGFMPLHRQFGFIFTGQSQSGAAEVKETSGSGLATVIAHEIGHGVFELEHPWEQYDYNRNSFSTNWLLDYASGTKLPYMHWQQISHPKTALYLFQSDSSGEYETDGHYSTVYLVSLMLGMNPAKALELAKATEAPDTTIHSETKFELNDTWAHMNGSQQNIHSLTGGFHGIEEFFTAIKFLNPKTNDINELGKLLHRFGDTYAHTKIGNLKPEDILEDKDLKNVDSLTIQKYTNEWKIESENSLQSEVKPWIKFFNYYLGKYGIHFLDDVQLQISIFKGKTLQQVLKDIYLTNKSSDFIMYGNSMFTFQEHALTDGGYPDQIYVRPNWYILYMQNLSWLISEKFKLDNSKLDTKIFSRMVYFVSKNKCSMKGIIDYEIAKKIGKKVFYVPVFFSDGRELATLDGVFISDYLQVSKDIVRNTKKYLIEQGISENNIKVEEIKGVQRKININGVFDIEAYKITIN